mgnify:CR=1 FL=1
MVGLICHTAHKGQGLKLGKMWCRRSLETGSAAVAADAVLVHGAVQPSQGMGLGALQQSAEPVLGKISRAKSELRWKIFRVDGRSGVVEDLLELAWSECSRQFGRHSGPMGADPLCDRRELLDAQS